jgi:hypothetical protein
MQAIDVWMGACTAFIFAALIEFTFVNYLYRRQRQNSYELNPSGVDLGDVEENNGMELTQVRRICCGLTNWSP